MHPFPLNSILFLFAFSLNDPPKKVFIVQCILGFVMGELVEMHFFPISMHDSEYNKAKKFRRVMRGGGGKKN